MKYETHSQLSRKKYFKVDETLNKRFERVESIYTLECGASKYSENLFKKFNELIELRNLVAHNPVFYESEDSAFCITNGQSKNKYINLSEIAELAENAYKTAFDLSILFRIWEKN